MFVDTVKSIGSAHAAAISRKPMARLAVISDIHGNLVAFEEVLRDIDSARVDAVLCLGDTVGYGPESKECLALMRRACRLAIRGNHEDALIDDAQMPLWNSVARTGIAYARRTMTHDELEFVAELPGSFSIAHVAFAVHDSPVPSDAAHGYLRTAEDAAFAFRGVSEPICLVGHTHIPGCFSTISRTDCQVVAPEEVTLFTPQDPEVGGVMMYDLSRFGRTIMNPGSVGQPRDGDPRASYAIVDLEHSLVEFRRVAYDIELAARRFRAAGLPEATFERLALGA